MAYAIAIKERIEIAVNAANYDTIEYSTNIPVTDAEGASGVVVLKKIVVDPAAPKDLSTTKITIVPFYYVVADHGGKQKIKVPNGKTIKGPATTAEHEKWHTDGAPRHIYAADKNAVKRPGFREGAWNAKTHFLSLLATFIIDSANDPTAAELLTKINEFAGTSFGGGGGIQRIVKHGYWHTAIATPGLGHDRTYDWNNEEIPEW